MRVEKQFLIDIFRCIGCDTCSVAPGSSDRAWPSNTAESGVGWNTHSAPSRLTRAARSAGTASVLAASRANCSSAKGFNG